MAAHAAAREVRFVHVRGHSSDEGNDRADALVQWGKKSRAYARLRERKEGEQEDIDIIKEGHIASDGIYGRLAIEEYEKEKREKRKENIVFQAKVVKNTLSSLYIMKKITYLHKQINNSKTLII